MRELECFAAVAEELSFTRAAGRLRLAQPPLSRHVRTLEEKLGTALFDRSGRKVSLTPAGAVFYDEIRGVLPQLARAGEATRRFVRGQTTRLRLGFVSAVLSPELVATLRRFRAQHPSVQLVMQDCPPAEQLALLDGGGLDGGFVGVAPAEKHPGIQFTVWRREALSAFVPFEHPLSRRKELEVKELSSEALVAVSGEAAPSFAAHIRDLCRSAGFRPRIVAESARAQAVAVMVAAGAGIALLPESLARVVGDGAAVIPLRRVKPITHVFARRAGHVSPPLRELMKLLEPAS